MTVDRNVRWRWMGLALVLQALASPAYAADVAAGTVKKASGAVRIERGGAVIPVLVGTVVMASDRVVTGADSSVGLTLRDDTLLSAGPNSALVVNRFAFDATTNEGSIGLQVLKGTMRTITGLIARQSPSSLEVKTPTATVGVRGTDFVVEVPE